MYNKSEHKTEHVLEHGLYKLVIETPEKWFNKSK